MKILAIETSCDETAMCLIEATKTPLGVDLFVYKNLVHTQLEHREYGGVFPAVAKREHLINLPILLDQVLKSHPASSGSDPLLAGEGSAPDIDYICVTNGPGLEPALWCGIVFAKELGEKWNIPVVPVNHMEGHVLSVVVPPLLAGEGSGVRFAFKDDDFQFPALALLISGGHTELVLVKAIGDYEIIGKTRDDAVGEAFDKVARLLGLEYPGGPEISKLAAQALLTRPPHGVHPLHYRGEGPHFPRPMIHTKDFDFSFSGLKTAVLYYTQELLAHPHPVSQAKPPSPLRGEGPGLTDDQKIAIAHEFQEAVTDVLVTKTKKAVAEYDAQTLIVAGGVSANTRIISALKSMIETDFPEAAFMAPARELTGDNALMIALAGYFKVQKNPDAVYGDIRAEGNLSL